MADSEQMARGALTREEILLKFPPKIEMTYPREDRVRQGLVSPDPVEFVVSRDETGKMIFAMGAEGFYRSLEDSNQDPVSSGREMPQALGESSGPRIPGHPASPALQRSLSEDNPANVSGSVRDGVTGGYYSRRESRPSR